MYSDVLSKYFESKENYCPPRKPFNRRGGSSGLINNAKSGLA
jgi:hypothetical protein